MSKRWTVIALGLLLLALTLLSGGGSAGAAGAPLKPVAPLTLQAQTPWVQASAPWFNVTLGIGEPSIPAKQLHINLIFYDRISSLSQFEQFTGATPDNRVRSTVTDVAVTTTSGGRSASSCVTVLPNTSATAPTTTTGSTNACPANAPIVYLNCTPGLDTCGDIYPVSVALYRQGNSNSLARFTTFLTYEQPSAVGDGGALRVSWVLPLGSRTALASALPALSTHHQVPVTLAVNPQAVSSADSSRTSRHLVGQLGALTSGTGADELVNQPYVPVNLAALETAGLGGEITGQVNRGLQMLHDAKLHPTTSTWVDTDSDFTSGTAGALAAGTKQAHIDTLVLNDTDLAGTPSADTKYAQAHPFSLELGRGDHVTALAANSSLDSRFTALPKDPVLAANQLLAGAEFIHFQNALLDDKRGIVLVPPSGWRASSTFIEALLTGLGNNHALSPVTLSSMLNQVQAGGDNDDPSPTTRRLQGGSAAGNFSRSTASRIASARQDLSSLTAAVSGHPSELSTLNDQLLSTESSTLSNAKRTGSVSRYFRSFDHVIGEVSLAPERTITFTSRTAAIPITVVSTAPFRVRVVLSIQSDKFNFPNGDTRSLLLDRPTTPVRVQAHARTSGDRLPVEVTLRTPDGRLVLARATLTVHSTSISIVGIALTVLAGLVLLVWWGRTWRRSRLHRPRAH
ncbi:MAG TPA: DUF6049 family protein [Acidimicrobiales bacterium]